MYICIGRIRLYPAHSPPVHSLRVHHYTDTRVYAPTLNLLNALIKWGMRSRISDDNKGITRRLIHLLNRSEVDQSQSTRLIIPGLRKGVTILNKPETDTIPPMLYTCLDQSSDDSHQWGRIGNKQGEKKRGEKKKKKKKKKKKFPGGVSDRYMLHAPHMLIKSKSFPFRLSRHYDDTENERFFFRCFPLDCL